MPVTNVKTEAAQIDQTMNQEIIFARLCTGFAFLALIIAGIGLYGTMTYTVARRTGEIGIRMASGAPRASVAWMVLREVLILAGRYLWQWRFSSPPHCWPVTCPPEKRRASTL